MKDLKLRLFRITGNSKVFEMPPRELSQFVINEILPDEKGFVSDKFMLLMADYLQDFYIHNKNIGDLFAEIAMRRISNGSILAYDIYCEPWNSEIIFENTKLKVPCFKNLVKIPSVINQPCADFLLKQSRFILKTSEKSHMRDILFALVDDMSCGGYYNTIITDIDLDRIMLSTFAKDTLYDLLPFSEMMAHLAKKGIWKKYKSIIQNNWDKIDKKEFARKIGMTGCCLKIRLYFKVFL